MIQDSLKQTKEQVMDDAGVFDSFSSEAVVSQTSKTDSDTKDIAVAVIVSKYANQKVTYTISSI